LVDERERVVVRNRPFVDFSVVHDRTKRTVELLNKEEGRRDGGLSFYYSSRLDVLIDKLSTRLHFVGCQRVYFGSDGSRSSIDELDFMVPYSFRRELIKAFLSKDFREFGIFLGYT